jgi:zinc protease
MLAVPRFRSSEVRGSGSCLFATLAAVLAVVASLTAQQVPDRSTAPVPGAPPILKLPPIQKRALGNGLPVWIVEMHEVPVADITVIIKAGAADPAAKFGLADFTAAMLDEGAGTRDALAIADAVDFLGASLGTGSSYDASTVRLHTPVSKLDDALQILADVLLRPTFPDADLERLRKERLTFLLQMRDQPASLASAAFARLVFGPRHRYGTPRLGNETSNTEMSVVDLKGFYSTYYQPQGAHVLVVGDVTADSVLPKLERTLGAWKNTGAVPKTTVPAAPQHPGRQIYLVDKPNAAQSEIRIGGVGVARNTPDYFVLDVLNTILGGSFTSRLNQNLREEHGYAYGAGSVFDMRGSNGPFIASAAVQTDKTVESLREMFKELDGIHKPVPADELAKARNLEALGFPAGFETTTGMAGNLAELVIYSLPESFFSEYVPTIQAVTAADLARASGQYVPADKLAVVVVGDLAKIEKPIRDANLGPVKVVKVDEVLK